MEKYNTEEIRRKSEEFEGCGPGEILGWCWERYGEKAAVGTSFQGAGLVVLNEAYSRGWRFPVFTLDTGLLFPETLEFQRQIEERFGMVVESLVPELTVEEQAREYGPEIWKSNPDLCCSLRKVLPLQAKLNTIDVWITGLRRDQSEGRAGIRIAELYHFDVLRDRSILKLNPLADWTRQKVLDYLALHNLPTNPLAARGFRSIGCMPCTRAVGGDEGERAGRWTGFNKSECGIHTFLGASI